MKHQNPKIGQMLFSFSLEFQLPLRRNGKYTGRSPATVRALCELDKCLKKRARQLALFMRTCEIECVTLSADFEITSSGVIANGKLDLGQ